MDKKTVRLEIPHARIQESAFSKGISLVRVDSHPGITEKPMGYLFLVDPSWVKGDLPPDIEELTERYRDLNGRAQDSESRAKGLSDANQKLEKQITDKDEILRKIQDACRQATGDSVEMFQDRILEIMGKL